MSISRSAACIFVLWCCFALPASPAQQPASRQQLKKLLTLDAAGTSDVYVWTDTANSYIIRDGDTAILIDLGDGSVLKQLAKIGVRQVEWVLFTHHHREQLQGYPLLQGFGSKIGVPEAERAFFENPFAWRKMTPALGDRFTVHATSYVRP